MEKDLNKQASDWEAIEKELWKVGASTNVNDGKLASVGIIVELMIIDSGYAIAEAAEAVERKRRNVTLLKIAK